MWRSQVNPNIWVHLLALSDGFGPTHTRSPDLQKYLLEDQIRCNWLLTLSLLTVYSLHVPTFGAASPKPSPCFHFSRKLAVLCTEFLVLVSTGNRKVTAAFNNLLSKHVPETHNVQNIEQVIKISVASKTSTTLATSYATPPQTTPPPDETVQSLSIRGHAL